MGKDVKSVTVKELCSQVGISRQGFYKAHREKIRQDLNELEIVEMVKLERFKHPMMGGRKLHSKLKSLLFNAGIEIGRDRFFKVLKKHNLLIKRRIRYCKTTNSNHSFRKYNNLIKDIEIIKPNQVWVSDLTYISTREGFLYLSLITDAYSRKIVGYEVNDTLESIGCEKALNKALKQLSFGERPIHHSDQGIQYCSKIYTNKLKSRNMLISMTEENHCYENAQAERVNGILKTEYYLGLKFDNKLLARRSCKQAIYLYNSDRPHLSLNMKTPSMVHSNFKARSIKELN